MKVGKALGPITAAEGDSLGSGQVVTLYGSTEFVRNIFAFTIDAGARVIIGQDSDKNEWYVITVGDGE
jgi:hypothetical protein